MDRRATLQTRVLSRNTQGEEVVTYSDLAEVWAEKWDLKGREWFSAQQLNADVTTKFRIRYRSDVTVLHRIVCDGIYYDIQHVAEVGREGGLEIMAVAKVP